MMDGPEVLFGFGAGMALVAIVAYFLLVALMLWVMFLIIRAAVTSGILRAARKGAFVNGPQHQQLHPQGYQQAPNMPSSQGGPR